MKNTDRDTFIQKNMGLVGMVVNKHAYRVAEHTYIDREDLRSIGTIGLIKAYDRFDPSFGTQFSTYAVPMIAGEIKRYLRDNLDSVRFSRQSKEDFYAISSANLLSEEPQLISDTLEIPIDRVENALEYYRLKNMDSLDKEVFDEGGNPIVLADRIGTEVDFDSGLELEIFLNKLDKRTRKIVELRLQDLHQKEIGEIMGVTQVQISRILGNLKNKLKGGSLMFNNKPAINKVEEKKEIKIIQKEETIPNTTNFTLAKTLAEQTDLNPSQISRQSGVSYTTARKYVKDFRKAKAENKSEVVAERINATTQAHGPTIEEKVEFISEKTSGATQHYSEPVEEKPIQKDISAYGHMAMTFEVGLDGATSRLEDIISAMRVLGFEGLKITIQGEQVA